MINIETNIVAALKKAHQNAESSVSNEIRTTLQDIQSKIINNGDSAVIDFTAKFDKISTENFSLKVTEQEIELAMSKVPSKYISSAKKAIANITNFHSHQIPKSWEKSPQDGVEYGLTYNPIESVGLYVPGGRAPYPSTVMMDAIPAKLAKVPRIAMTTPPQPDGSIPNQILAAAYLCGVNEIYKVGGAQAVFSLAHGTESIPKVNKIVGPGNVYVDLAKQMVYGKVDIDKPAGPSDVLVVIEDKKYAPFAAAEMLAQLEHDPDAIAISLSSKKTVLHAINDALNHQIKSLSRQDIIKQSIQNSVLFFEPKSDMVIKRINEFSAEHLVLLIDEPKVLLKDVKNAGSIFCGPYTPVTLGDYFAGPNHVLPTSGTARFASPLGVMDFLKYSTHLTYSKESLKSVKDDLNILTQMEGFDAHYNAVEQRLN